MSEKYAIRIHWGYWARYDPCTFHHVNYCWDGEARVDNGRILECSLIEFEGLWGPQSERFVPLNKPCWHWHPKNNYNRLAGILLHIQGNSDTVLHFCTRTTDMSFRVADLIEKKVIHQHVGSRYGRTNITALFDSYDPNLDRPEDVTAMVEADGRWRKLIHVEDFRGHLQRWYRTDWVWIAPGESAEVDIEEPKWKEVPGKVQRSLRATFCCVAAVPGKKSKRSEEITEGETDTTRIHYRVFLNNQEVAYQQQYFGAHNWLRGQIPHIEEIAADLPGNLFHTGKNALRIKNDGKRDYILVARLYLEEKDKSDPEVTLCPRWVLQGQKFEIAVQCRSLQKDVRVTVPPGVSLIDNVPRELGSGEHRFCFQAQEPLSHIKIEFESDKGTCQAEIEQVVAAKQEDFPMRVGVEDNLFPPDSPGLKEGILRELKNTQLGDFIVFRLAAQNRDQVIRWARLCRDNNIYFQTNVTIDPDWQTKGADMRSPAWSSAAGREAGEYFIGCQWQEHDGPLYNYLPTTFAYKLSVPEEKRTMRTAYEDYLAYVKRLFAICKQADSKMPAWFQLSVIGHDHPYKTRMDGCAAQLNKSHNVVLLADARGAARTHGKSVWGSYSAEGAHLNPEGEEHLRMWWLALHLSYICGASFASDEECLLRSWHSYQYARVDRFPRMRQEILRRFNRYVKTHPRRGRIRVKQALLIGRYACDVADGFASSEGPWVWCNFGARTPQWQPLTPEYGLRYLDVFFPGVWLQSLVQCPEYTRRLYSGTPYGELELIPIEAPESVLKEFRLLLVLGWNTMNEATYERLKKYVKQGGQIFMSVPHLTTNESRSFLLNNMEPLELLRKGDFSELFGVKVTGRGKRIHSIKAVGGRKHSPIEGVEYPSIHGSFLPPVDPKHSPVDLAKVELCGAEVLAQDGETGQPVLVRYRLGQGEAYLLLTYDFPGNSWLWGFMTDLIHGLAKTVPSPVGLEDPSGDVYYTVREETETKLTRIHLLNTDWTESGNERRCVLRLGENDLKLTVKEGQLSEVIWLENLAMLVQDEKVYVEEVSLSSGIYSMKLHGFDKGEIFLQAMDKEPFKAILFEGKPANIVSGEEWTVVKIDFGGKTIGNLSVGVQ